jgi:acyl dehydratase
MSDTTPLSAPPYFEDYIVGVQREFGTIVVEEAEVISFARRFDPQPFHTDPAAAKGSIYGGLIASGWHTASLMMRLFADHYLTSSSSLGSPGVDELRWLKPVRPGDTIQPMGTIKSKTRSAKAGWVVIDVVMHNQRGEVVATGEAQVEFPEAA